MGSMTMSALEIVAKSQSRTSPYIPPTVVCNESLPKSCSSSCGSLYTVLECGMKNAHSVVLDEIWPKWREWIQEGQNPLLLNAQCPMPIANIVNTVR